MNPSSLFGLLPQSLRDELVESFNKIVRNYREGRWEPSELDGGKICEITYSILKGYIDGVYPQKSYKPKDMVTACRQLEQTPLSFSRSVRIQIPRILLGLYEVRNNRGVGHVGGEVNSNHMDASLVLYSAKWIMAELIRIFHNLDTTSATAAVEMLTEREVPAIWNVNGKKRVLKQSLSMKEKTLLFLYSEPTSLSEEKLIEWTEHSNIAVYRRDILTKWHKDKSKLWEYDKSTKQITISPNGILYVESKLLK